MTKLMILMGVVLAIGAGIAFAEDAPANPLAGKTFRSLEKLPGGETANGTIVMTHWTIRFKDNSYSWRYTDVISEGKYEYDAKTGTLTIKGEKRLQASYDAKTAVLTWAGNKYEAVEDGKQ